VSLKLRFPEKLRRQLEQSAFYSRSMNAEIIYRLEQAFSDDRARRQERQRIKEDVWMAQLDEALLRAVKKMEQSGFKIARVPKTADETEDGEKK
jgi:Arc-like DNA binding domain